MIVGDRKGLRLSDMRHRVTVQTLVETVNASRQKVQTYTDRLTEEPATFEQVSGGEYNRGQQVEAGVTAVFKVNYRTGYSVTDRIVYAGQNYGIVSIEAPVGINRFLFLQCKAAPVG